MSAKIWRWRRLAKWTKVFLKDEFFMMTPKLKKVVIKRIARADKKDCKKLGRACGCNHKGMQQKNSAGRNHRVHPMGHMMVWIFDGQGNSKPWRQSE